MHLRAVRDRSIGLAVPPRRGSTQLTQADELDVDGRRVALSNLGRVLWPEAGFTKGALVHYYLRIGPRMVPHLAGRPLMLGRFPEGVRGRGWGQFECRGRPEWMSVQPMRLKTGQIVELCVVNDVASLVWLANQGVVELHPYLARGEALDRPTTVVFDLDPGPPAGLLECCECAISLRDVLTEAGLASFVKTSGSFGLHVLVPLNVDHTYAETKAFARAIAARLSAEVPERVVDTMAKSARVGRVFIDWAQNDERKQTVAAYSLRATPIPLVSTPVAWDEIDGAVMDRDASRLRFSPQRVVERLAAMGDIFRPTLELRQRLPAAAGSGIRSV